MSRTPVGIATLVLAAGLFLILMPSKCSDIWGPAKGAAWAQQDDADDDDDQDDDDEDSGGSSDDDAGGGSAAADDDSGAGGSAGGQDDNGGSRSTPGDGDGGGGRAGPGDGGQTNAGREDGRRPGGSGSDAGTPPRRQGATSASRPARPTVPVPQSRPPAAFAPEIVVSDLGAADLDLLLAEGFTLIERRQIVTLATTLDRLAPPPGRTLTEARDRVRALATGRDADFNHFYRTSAEECSHENCSAWTLVGWPVEQVAQDIDVTATPQGAEVAGSAVSGQPCGPPVPVGVIDTGINPDHGILRGAKLTLIPRASGVTSGAVHGTAVVSLLVGQAGSRVPGLLPGAEVVAVDVFRKDQGEERADLADLVEGLDLLASRSLRLYSLSLAGPENSVLTRMVDRLTDPAGLDAVVVAAAGNGGPEAAVAWPAAHPMALAVTAVDRRGRVYPAAQRGDHLALAAPGVGLLAATSLRGARTKTGTSFAVPFVTAAAALVLGSGATGAEVRAALVASARDLGAQGRDPIFGHGLLSFAELCRENPGLAEPAVE